jgi:oligopeptidase A
MLPAPRPGQFDNAALTARILELRQEKAKLLGFANFADLVLVERMAKAGAAARVFVDDLYEKTKPFSQLRTNSWRPSRPAA